MEYNLDPLLIIVIAEFSTVGRSIDVAMKRAILAPKFHNVRQRTDEGYG